MMVIGQIKLLGIETKDSWIQICARSYINIVIFVQVSWVEKAILLRWVKLPFSVVI